MMNDTPELRPSSGSEVKSEACGPDCDCGPPPPTRRAFLANAALAAGATALGSRQITAGPFRQNERHREVVPADKKLDPAWTRSLYERGTKDTWDDPDALRHIGMPVGGFFAGTVYLGGDGRLWLWDIFNRDQEGIAPREFDGEVPNRKAGDPLLARQTRARHHNHTPPHGTCRKHPWPRNTTRPHETTHDACAELPSPHLGLRARQADSTPLTSDANDLSSAPPCRPPRPTAARTRPKTSRLDDDAADELEPRGPARQLTVARPTSSTPGVHADADHATTALTADPNDGAPDPPSGASCPSSTRPRRPRRSAAPATRRTGTRNTTRRSVRTPMRR